MASMTRPVWWSAYSRNAPYTSIWCDRMGRRSAGTSSHAGMPSERSVSSASAGTMPSSFCRAKVSSRSASQPWSYLPSCLAIHSRGTWCGACVAPGAK